MQFFLYFLLDKMCGRWYNGILARAGRTRANKKDPTWYTLLRGVSGTDSLKENGIDTGIASAEKIFFTRSYYKDFLRLNQFVYRVHDLRLATSAFWFYIFILLQGVVFYQLSLLYIYYIKILFICQP